MSSSHLGADISFLWPTADIVVMGAEPAADLSHRREISAAAYPSAERQKKIDEYNAILANPYTAASRGYIDSVIVPSGTRPRLIGALEAICNKRETALPKKHGSIPL